ncbi:MAG: hypothetical protein VX438_16845 [Planctomycetota bacterium]|nr:hypothetical protein [Planctomycetota bacterium]
MKHHPTRKHKFTLALTISLLLGGCSGQPENHPAATTDKPTVPKPKTTKINQGTPAAKVVSQLPYREIDLSTAQKGINPGRIIINATGKDSTGRDMALSDYKGKVILLDTWASW